MRAITFDGQRVLYQTDYLRPVFRSDESLIRVELAAICSTDREIIKGYRPDFYGVMGHEFVGVVEDGSQPDLIGKRVVGEINLSCGHCIYCQSGREHHCLERKTLGINRKDGCFADFLTLPNHLIWPVGGNLVAERAIFTEPMAAALRITEQISFAPRMPVAIVGDGRLALLISQALAAKTTSSLTVFGRHRDKLSLFEPHADVATEPTGSYEVVIDASGNPSSLATSLSLTRSQGTLVIKSTYAGLAEIDMSEVVVREITIIGSRCGSFQPALELLASDTINLPDLELYDPADFQAAFDSAVFKATFDFRG
jgi:threonine dehydrogenase-like Zn-dependent dehydrogenase